MVAQSMKTNKTAFPLQFGLQFRRICSILRNVCAYPSGNEEVCFFLSWLLVSLLISQDCDEQIIQFLVPV